MSTHRVVECGVRHLPDAPLSDAEKRREFPREIGAGHFEFGAVIDGAFIPFVTVKAGRINKILARHAASVSQATPTDTQ